MHLFFASCFLGKKKKNKREINKEKKNQLNKLITEEKRTKRKKYDKQTKTQQTMLLFRFSHTRTHTHNLVSEISKR